MTGSAQRIPQPSEEELREFARSVLANAGQGAFDEAQAVEDTLREHRDLWVMLYRAELGVAQ